MIFEHIYMFKYLIWGGLCGISLSLLYFTGSAVKYSIPFKNIKQLWNPGLIIGIGIGCLRAYTEKPIFLY